MKLLLDMNLPTTWVGLLATEGHEAVHWSSVGDWRAPDRTVIRWAAANGCVVLTRDLDYPAILAATESNSPSVILVRGPDPLGETLVRRTIAAIEQSSGSLESGALVVVEVDRSRCRVLPLVQQPKNE